MTSRFSCRPSSLPVMLRSFVAKKSFRMSALFPCPNARSSAERFAEAVRYVGDDSEEARRQRVERVRTYSWERRIDEMEAAIEAAAVG